MIAATLVFLAVCPTWAGAVIYVDDDAPLGGNGASWDTAYRYLQDALVGAEVLVTEDSTGAVQGSREVRMVACVEIGQDGDPCCVEIRVAQGGYKPDEGANKTPGDRRASFELGSGLALKGGYAGLGMPNPNARDITLYETILSGDLAGDDVDVNDPCDLENDLSRAENSYHVVYIENSDDTTLLESVIVTGGSAWTIGGPGRGASWKQYSGGGLLCLSSEGPVIAKCTFLANFAEMGGGVYNSSNAKIIECTFTMNAASAIGGEGGGMLSGGKPVIEKCEFIRNLASGGGGMAANNTSEAIIINSIFVENCASAGGAAWFISGSEQFRNCSFIRNSALGGGALRNGNNRLILLNCLFSQNFAKERGGAIDNNANKSLVIEDCTFADNSSPNGNAISRGGNLSINSSVFWDGGQEIHDVSPVAVVYSNVQGGWLGAGNIDLNPLFVEPDNGDYHLKSQAGRWDPNNKTWIQDDVTSPCIDAGDPNSPIMYESFPNGGVINMGAYGGAVEASKSYFGGPVCETIVAGDINGDGRVDFEDLVILMSHWTEGEY